MSFRPAQCRVLVPARALSNPAVSRAEKVAEMHVVETMPTKNRGDCGVALARRLPVTLSA
jgi:hypothetical protein